MCTQAILKDLIDPLKGEVALLFVTKFHCSGGKLVILSESELLKIRSFGKTSLREIRRKLADIGLAVGMTDLNV